MHYVYTQTLEFRFEADSFEEAQSLVEGDDLAFDAFERVETSLVEEETGREG